MNSRRLFSLAVSVSLTFVLSGQYYETGQDPANLKWLQIKTDRFRVIYPVNYGSNGIEFAKELDKAYSDLGSIFPERKFRIPVIIHNQTTQSNGYVAWAPRRMELYPTPEQNSIPLDANRQLVLHELTHVYQMESLDRGFTKGLSFLLGQQFPGVVASLLPQWYMEGEAVYAESVLTESGRGRSPSFQKGLKAISVEKGKMYRYDKIVNGSFRNYVPDHYQSGYQIVAWTKAEYNPDTWDKVLKTTANAPYLLNPVNLSLRNTTRHNKRTLFREAFDTLGKAWIGENIRKETKTYAVLSPPMRKDFVNYFSPVKINDNSFMAIKTTLYNPPEFVIINSLLKSEEKLFVPGYMSNYHISAGNMMVVWVEFQSDPRWENRNYSVIKLLDLRSRQARQVSWKSRYMSAAISPDGKIIAATENTSDNKNNLILLNTNTGKIIKSVPVNGNAYLQRPQWSSDGELISFISLTKQGEGIVSFRPSDQSWQSLIAERPEDFQSTFIRNDSLFYISSVSGTENLYVLSPEGSVARITNSRFGSTDLLISGGNALFCDYSSSGNSLCFTSINMAVPVPADHDSSFFFIDRINIPQASANVEAEKKYIPEKYRKLPNLFGFHSWMPFYADIEEVKSDPASIRPGATIMTQNHLSTLIATAGYEYSGQLHKFHGDLTWQGWYPVIKSDIDYGDSPLINKPSNIANPLEVKPGISWTNTIYLPLSFRTGKFSLYLQPSLTSTYKNDYLYSTESSVYDYSQIQVAGRFYFSNSYLTAARDIYPRIAQVVDIYYSSYPFDTEHLGSDLTLRTAFYFPGIFRNNSLRIRYENEFQSAVKFLNFNLIKFPRGFKNIISEDLSYFSADYFFPLVYPDINLASFLYLKRIRAGLFTDYGQGTNNYYLKFGDNGYEVTETRNITENFISYGTELVADFHLLRLPYMISAGVQAAWQKGEKIPSLEAIFSINIYGMSIGNRPRL